MLRIKILKEYRFKFVCLKICRIFQYYYSFFYVPVYIYRYAYTLYMPIFSNQVGTYDIIQKYANILGIPKTIIPILKVLIYVLQPIQVTNNIMIFIVEFVDVF